MFETRIHGRGGQGVVTAAELLSVAAFLDGRYAQAFPSFGSERMGAPVVAYCRIDYKPIRTREPISRPDALIIQDPTLLQHPDVFRGLQLHGFVLINSSHSADRLALGEHTQILRTARILTVPATELALKHIGRPVPNAVLLGSFAAFTRRVSLGSVVAAIEERFSGPLAAGNAGAARAAFDYVNAQREELAHA